MKLEGHNFEAVPEDVIVIPRPSTVDDKGETISRDIVFKVRAVLDFSEFKKLNPVPTAPFIKRPGQAAVPNLEAPEFRAALLLHSGRRVNWIVLKSLEATPGLKWDKVNLSDPTTWDLWKTELTEAYFSEEEIIHILNAVIRINGMSEEHLDLARQSFLASKGAAQNKSSSPTEADDQQTTQLGEPAKDSESSRRE